MGMNHYYLSRCNNGVKELKIAKPKSTAPVYKYMAPTPHKICDSPKLMDPYEQKTIYVKDSGYAGDTVYAKRPILAGEIVAYYVGTKYLRGTYRNLTGQDE